MVLCLVNADEEEQLGDEEVDAEVLVDCVAVGLQAPQEAKGGDADGQTHEGDDNSHPGDHKQDQLMHSSRVLRYLQRRAGVGGSSAAGNGKKRRVKVQGDKGESEK